MPLYSPGGITANSTAIASGTDTRVLFDDGGALGEDSGFTYNKTTDFATFAGGIVVPLALVGTPSITFAGDSNTGIWSNTADTIDFSVGGSNRFRFNSNFFTTGGLLIGGSAAVPNVIMDPQGAGKFTVKDGGGGSTAMIQFGGTTAAFPAVSQTALSGGWQFDVRSAADTNGQACSISTLTELTTIAAAATTDTTILMPAASIILSVSVRVTVALNVTTNFTVGDAGSAARFSTAAVSKAINSTDPGTKAGAYYNASATAVRITPDSTPGDTNGRVRVTIHYIKITPPTS
jgi:hypothetical protein